jgi:hypothetical protein
MTLHVWSAFTQVTTALTGPGRVDLFAVQRAGEPAPALLAEAYDADGLIAAGELFVWDINQAIAAMISGSTQARRLALRDDGRGHPGHLDVVQWTDRIDVVATAPDTERRAELTTTAALLANDLGTVLREYLALTRAGQRTIVLSDAPAPEPAGAVRPVALVQPASARAALTRPEP